MPSAERQRIRKCLAMKADQNKVLVRAGNSAVAKYSFKLHIESKIESDAIGEVSTDEVCSGHNVQLLKAITLSN